MSYYLCKVKIEGSGTTEILVEDTGITESEVRITNHLKDSGSAYEITEIKKTKIESVLKLTDE